MTFNIENCSPSSKLDDYRKFFKLWQTLTPWKKKKSLIVQTLDGLSQSYRQKFDTRSLTLTEESSLLRKLLYCLAHPRKDQNIDPKDVLSGTIQFLETNKPGGSNPLEDLTLADSLIAELSENRIQAKKYLERHFGGFAKQVARKWNDNYERFRQFQVEISSDLNDCDWWLDAYYVMVGYAADRQGRPQKAALDSYVGKTGIGPWIQTVVHFTIKKIIKPPKHPYIAEFLSALFPQMLDDDNDDSQPDFEAPQVSPILNADSEEFKVKIKDFWAELSRLEKTVCCYWNEKIAKHLDELLKKPSEAEDNPFDLIFTIRDNETREAYKICGDGLTGKPFVLEVKRKLEDFLKKSIRPEEHSRIDVMVYGALFYETVNELRKKYPVTEEDIKEDIKRRFGGYSPE